MKKKKKSMNYKKMLNKFRRKTFSLDGRGNLMSLATGHSLTKKKIITKKKSTTHHSVQQKTTYYRKDYYYYYHDFTFKV